MADSPFLIVGGGIAGLGASLGLARAGRQSLVLERAASFDGGGGAGIQITPNAVRALSWLGAWEHVEPLTTAPANIMVRDGHSGRLLQRITLGPGFEARFGVPYRVALRSDLLSGLLAAVRANPLIELRPSADATDMSIAETSLSLRSGERLRPTAIIGADGARSLVRRRLQGHDAPPSSTHMHFRRLIAAGQLPDADRANVTLWLCAGGHVVQYGVAGDKLNIVASVGSDTPEASPPIAHACPDLAEILSAPGEWSKWPALAHASDPAWHKGHTMLIGDAAHASLPYLAQGAAMALEDACVLAQQVAASTSTGTSSAFAAFARLRYPRTARLQATAQRLGSIYHARGPLRAARNLALRLVDERRFMKRMSWIYDWKP